MKKKIANKKDDIDKYMRLKVIACGIVLILLIATLFLGSSSSKIEGEVLSKLNNNIKDINKYVNKFNTPLTGTVTMSANYKGAHGESFPKDYEFAYALEDNTLYFSNKDGYTSLELNKDLVNIYNIFKSDLKEDIFVSKKSISRGNEITIELDVDKINEYLKQDFKEAKITINRKNAISNEIKDITLSMDDYIITIDDDSYKVMYQDQLLEVMLNKNGYSLAINKNIKMNAILRDDVDNYNIVIDNYIYSLETSDNTIKFNANSSASIYNSIEANFNASSDIVDKDHKADITKNPLTRYFNEKEK